VNAQQTRATAQAAHLTIARQTEYLTGNNDPECFAAMPTKYADVRGYATHYYYVGNTTLPDVVPDLSRGRKLILLHAAGSNGHSWHYQYEHLGKAHSPVAPDLPGHGRTSGVEGLRTVTDYADFTLALIDELKVDSAVIAGRSMGGAVAMDFALRHPNRVQALILIATAPKFDIPKDRIDGWHAVTMGRAPQPFTNDGYSPKTIKEKVEIIREGWGEQIRTDPRVRWTDMVACSQVDLRDQIGQITKPTLILAGADDVVTPPSDAEFIQSRIKGSRLEVIADAAHNLTTERPGEVNAAIEKFLAELK
jgi:pimeloyl-ACP methyl ester carboxylesterase